MACRVLNDGSIQNLFHITKTCLYNFYPLKPLFYIVKLGFTGVYIIFLISAVKKTLGGSNGCPQSMIFSRNMKNIRIFYLKLFIYLNRHVFVMRRFVSGFTQLFNELIFFRLVLFVCSDFRVLVKILTFRVLFYYSRDIFIADPLMS